MTDLYLLKCLCLTLSGHSKFFFFHPLSTITSQRIFRPSDLSNHKFLVRIFNQNLSPGSPLRQHRPLFYSNQLLQNHKSHHHSNLFKDNLTEKIEILDLPIQQTSFFYTTLLSLHVNLYTPFNLSNITSRSTNPPLLLVPLGFPSNP